MVFGVFVWAFCGLLLCEEKSPDEAPSREESGGLWVDCGWMRVNKMTP